MDLKGDINLDDIKNKILAFADKKTLINFGIGLGSVLVFLMVSDKRGRANAMIMNNIINNRPITKIMFFI